MKSMLIKDTTKSERIELIKQWSEPEDGLNETDFDIFDLYADYINGIKEIEECNADFCSKDGFEYVKDEEDV